MSAGWILRMPAKQQIRGLGDGLGHLPGVAAGGVIDHQGLAGLGLIRRNGVLGGRFGRGLGIVLGDLRGGAAADGKAQHQCQAQK